MTTNTDSFDENARQTGPLIDKKQAASPGAVSTITSRLGADYNPALTSLDSNRQVQVLERRLVEQQQQIQKLLALNQIDQEFEHLPDPDQAARSLVKILSKLIRCGVIGIYGDQQGEPGFKLLASAGALTKNLPPSLKPDTLSSLLKRALQNRQMAAGQHSGATSPLSLEGCVYRSFLAAPLINKNQVCGLALVADPEADVFGPGDLTLVETAASRFALSWEYAQRSEMLTSFIQSTTSFSNVQETGSLMERIASVARSTLKGRFAVVAKQNQQGWQLRSSGKAPLIFHSLHNKAVQFLEEAIKSPYSFRLRDLRNDPRSAAIELDSSDLCSLIASPIQTNGHNSGLILVFGKQDGNIFQDNDVFLVELLAANAARNLESCFLNQELRSNLDTTQLLNGLSLDILLAGDLHQAVYVIAQTALRLMQARSCGLVLVEADGRAETSVIFPTDNPALVHPYTLIQQVLDSQQTIYLSETGSTTRLAIPIQTSRRCYGALWLEVPEALNEDHHPAEEIRVLVNQASVALERLILLEETRSQAKTLEAINLQLEQSYHQTLRALMRALDARDSETEGHSERVNELADMLGREMGLSEEEHRALLLGALLHDIGKIAIPDHILHKKGPLDIGEWETMRKHPEKGVGIIQEINYLKDAIPIIYSHQERWDGSGYPQHSSSQDIPLLARIFAVVDVFDALTRDRPYRQSNLTANEALAYLEQQAGIQFDPSVVAKFVNMIRGK